MDPFPPGAEIVTSIPGGNGWSAVARNSSFNAGTLHVYALCIPLTS
ncbi:hypothetical protein ACFFV7_27815 [Nonomuraea spiralis]|uniref:Uncharacterized protein n=1 Tax=Nonomuraea spiralis TaxID=46182 RepID=A0ABV5IKI0_9ACTN|nr:hypothetical protein [Nonomuraea spiralis]